MKKEAAEMGADAVIGFYTHGVVKHGLTYDYGLIPTTARGRNVRHPGDFASGIAVKLLKDGETSKRTRGDFIAAIIPMEVEDKNLERARFMKEYVQRCARLELTSKGYYVL